MKRCIAGLAFALMLIRMLTAAAYAQEYQTVSQLRESVPARWTTTIETKWRDVAIDAEIGALLSGFLQNDPPHRHELEKIDVYCRALWAAYWRYLTADADRTLFYWSFYHSEYYTQAVAARSIPNYRTLEAFMDALDKRFHISERHDSGVLVANMIDGSVNAAVRVLRGEFSGDDRTLNTIYQTVIQPLFSVLGLRI